MTLKGDRPPQTAGEVAGDRGYFFSIFTKKASARRMKPDCLDWMLSPGLNFRTDRSGGSWRPETAEFGHPGSFSTCGLPPLKRIELQSMRTSLSGLPSFPSIPGYAGGAVRIWDLCGRLQRSELLSGRRRARSLLQPTTVPEKHENIWPSATSMIHQSAQAQLLHWRALDSHIAQWLYVNQ
jgi:hypothetical protein